MGVKDKTYLLFIILILSSVIILCTAISLLLRKTKLTPRQNYVTDERASKDDRIKLVWCTVSREEHKKCNNFAMANEREAIRVGYDGFKIECIQGVDKQECMQLLDQEKATIMTLDAGEIFVGGRFHSLVPIAQEVLEGGLQYYYSVAVVKKGSLKDVRSLFDLRGTRACFAGVDKFAGWIIPIYTLINEGGMEIIDCNNHVKTASKFFGPSCSVNCLTDRYNPIGDNSDRLCQLCIGKIPGGRCTSSDPYAGYEGAFRCLLEAGEVAFLKHTTIQELIGGDEFVSLSKDSFELLCKDGSRRPIEGYESCNWGRVPADAVVTTSATPFERRRKYQLFLEKAAELFSFKHKQNPPDRNGNEDNVEYDNFGNRVNDRPDYDQYKNRPSDRFKRQNPSDFDRQYGQNNDQYNRNRDQYGSTTYRPYSANDPHIFNREEYGENIDPYKDGSFNRNRDPYHNVNSPPREFYDYDRNNTYYETFSLFESTPRYGLHANLLFQDATRNIAPLSENLQTYTAFLGNAINIIMGIRECPVNKMTLCVTSEIEKDKCVKMRTALKAQLLKPEMECYKGHSQIHCMQAIRSGLADVTVLDASDVYTAGLNFELIPFISEVYNLNEPESYVVAAVKVSDPDTELTYLKGKYTCHGGINTAAGWVYPLAFLISNGWIRPYGCNSIRAAAEYFTKSCVPGALSTEYNTGVPYDNMCDLCHGASYRYCRRDASEDYYGHTGAFRCLVEGGGHVAFVTHTTVTQNTGGKREEWWARDNLNDDFQLLCTDGTRAEITEYARCNLGKVKANAVVTRGGYGYNETHINAFINLFMYAQTFYGKRTTDEFSMFSSQPPYTDLIFQDATTQLKVVHPTKRHYAEYLGGDFLRARRIVDCHAGSASLRASLILVLLSWVLLRSQIIYF